MLASLGLTLKALRHAHRPRFYDEVAENPTLDSPATQYRSTHAAGGALQGS